jgi:peroxiredoxin Q/BCP
MALLQAGEAAPDFCLHDQDEKEIYLKTLRGKWVILYFYPRDNTPGCTLEAVQFTAKQASFKKLNTVILGISPDSIKSHCKFIEKHDLTIQLLSDESHHVLEAYGAWGEKKMYGKSYLGVTRTTYLIDPAGIVKQVWSKVKVKGHVETVLEAVQQHQS